MSAELGWALEVARSLGPAEKRALIEALREELDAGADEPEADIMELEGLGAELWEGIDVDGYIREERTSWERSPI
jgi:hypothetical protein